MMRKRTVILVEARDGESMPALAARFGMKLEDFWTLNPTKRPPNDRKYYGETYAVYALQDDMEKSDS